MKRPDWLPEAWISMCDLVDELGGGCASWMSRSLQRGSCVKIGSSIFISPEEADRLRVKRGKVLPRVVATTSPIPTDSWVPAMVDLAREGFEGTWRSVVRRLKARHIDCPPPLAFVLSKAIIEAFTAAGVCVTTVVPPREHKATIVRLSLSEGDSCGVMPPLVKTEHPIALPETPEIVLLLKNIDAHLAELVRVWR